VACGTTPDEGDNHVSESERSALLVARQPARRRRIATALEGKGLTVVGEIAGPEGALPMLERCDPGVLVVELCGETDDPELISRNKEVLQFVRAARELVPGVRVIAVTEALDIGLLVNAVTTGVDAYVLESDAY